MKIKFSRHAARRAKLYGIQLSVVEQIIRETNLIIGDQEIIRHIPDMNYPVKIVVAVENELITVITNYPLK